MGHLATEAEKETVFVPDFTIKENASALVFKADVPGVDPGDLDVKVTPTRLIVSGHRDEEKRQEGDTVYSYERSFGSFRRAFALPEGFDAGKVTADLKEGVLTVVVPKRAWHVGCSRPRA